MTGAHLAKRSFSLAGHRTSVALEPEFWRVLEQVAAARGLGVAALVAGLDAARDDPTIPLASALRVFALRQCCEDRPATDTRNTGNTPCSSP